VEEMKSSAVEERASALSFEGLLGMDGMRHSLFSLAGARATIVVFTANGCPTARSYEDRLEALQSRWGSDGVRLVAINSNNPYLSPSDTLQEMVARSAKRGWSFPYLKDRGCEVAKSYGAICTPHAFVLDHDLKLVYSGRIDDSRTGNTVSSRDLENALAELADGRAVAVDHTEPFGCSIVW